MRAVLSAILDRFFRSDSCHLLLDAAAHPPEATHERHALIIQRAQAVSRLFYVLTVAWIIVDALTVVWPLSTFLIPIRLATALGFVVLARHRFEVTRADAYTAVGSLIGIAIAFCLASNIALWWFEAAHSHFTTSTYLYAPFLIAAGLSFFPLTALECIVLAIPILGTMTVAANMWAEQEVHFSVTATLIRLSLMLTIGCASAMSQLQFLLMLIERSAHDALTGALNRRAGAEILNASFAMAKRNNRPLSALFLDLDRFKYVNDKWGHQVGDEVLKMVVRSMRECLRKQDFIVRWGGEEFVIILPETDRAGAENVVRAIAARGIGLRPDRFPQTASIGISERTVDPAKDWLSLVRTADQRMYAAKQAGRNRYLASGNDLQEFIADAMTKRPGPTPPHQLTASAAKSQAIDRQHAHVELRHAT